MQFRQREKESARTKAVAQRIAFPGRALDPHGRKQTGRQIRYKIAPRSPLYQNACQIRPRIVIHKAGSGSIFKRLRQAQPHPIVLIIKRPLLSHEKTFFLSKPHGQQIADSGFLQMLTGGLGNVTGKGIRQLFVQGQQPLLHSKAYGAGCKAFCGGVDVAAAFSFTAPGNKQLIVLCHVHTQNAKALGLFTISVKTRLLHNATPLTQSNRGLPKE